MMGYAYVATTIALTVYGQVIIKWQVDRAGAFPESLSGKFEFLTRLLVDPWIISALAGAVLAALAWMAAMTRFELSRAYPFVALSFVLVLLVSALVFDEAITAPKVIGIVLIAAGVAIASQ